MLHLFNHPPPLLHLNSIIHFPHSPPYLHYHHLLILLLHSHSLSSTSTSPTTFATLLQGHLPHSHLLQLHAHIFKLNAHQDNLIATRLIGHYTSHFALRVFRLLHSPNTYPFNAIIRVLAEDGLYSDALLVFKRLKLQLLSPNDLTFSFLLKSCFRAKEAYCVQQIHTHVWKVGFGDNAYVCNGLVAVYGKGQRDLVSARKVFDEMPDRSLVCCWTCLISGYSQFGYIEDVLSLFVLMVKENLRPENDTMVSVLSACSNLEIAQIDKWVRIISSEFRNKLDSKNFGHGSVDTVLVYLYGKEGKVEKSREIFDEMSDNGKRNVLNWNVMISAYFQNGCAVEALSIFRLMMEKYSCRPNHVTVVSVLSACAQIGDLELGTWVHEYMKSEGRKNIISSNTNLATALIDMYFKCGSLERAREVLDQMITKDVVSFNATIMGLAINGKGEEALSLFSKMQEFGLNPNAGTLLGVLCACSHSGLLEKGRQIFKDMRLGCSIAPKLEHYACYIDLLARMGCVEEALEIVSSMPFEPNDFVWGALLGGCVLHNRLELARDISSMLFKVAPENSAGYVMLSNAFAVDHRWSDVLGTRRFMKENGVRKQLGSSWININGTVHEFLAGYQLHPQNDIVYHALHGLLKEMKLESAQVNP